jgi:hypothetical protein
MAIFISLVRKASENKKGKLDAGACCLETSSAESYPQKNIKPKIQRKRDSCACTFSLVIGLLALSNQIRFKLMQLVSVGGLTLTFFLPITSTVVCTNLQHLAHNHISINHASILFISQHHHFRFYFVDNEFEKIY